MKTGLRLYWIWGSLVIVIILGGLITAILWPESLAKSESQSIYDKVLPYDTVIIFNPGGWGNSTLSE
jgi:hypothetical protein